MASAGPRAVVPFTKELLKQCDAPENGRVTLEYHYEKTSETESEVVDIVFIKEAPKRYRCDICSREFTVLSDFRSHQKLHIVLIPSKFGAGAVAGAVIGATLGPVGAIAGYTIGGVIGLLSSFI